MSTPNLWEILHTHGLITEIHHILNGGNIRPLTVGNHEGSIFRVIMRETTGLIIELATSQGPMHITVHATSGGRSQSHIKFDDVGPSVRILFEVDVNNNLSIYYNASLLRTYFNTHRPFVSNQDLTNFLILIEELIAQFENILRQAIANNNRLLTSGRHQRPDRSSSYEGESHTSLDKKQKYLKYKQKYLELKKKLENNNF